MQCKDIPDRPILEFLSGRLEQQHTWFAGYENSVSNAMPKDIPDKLVLAKMRQMIRRGVVKGCGCGCRGGFEITQKGLEEIK